MAEKDHFCIRFIVHIFVWEKKQQDFNKDYGGKKPQYCSDESFLNIQFHVQIQL